MIEQIFPGIGTTSSLLCVCSCKCYAGDPLAADNAEDWNREGISKDIWPD